MESRMSVAITSGTSIEFAVWSEMARVCVFVDRGARCRHYIACDGPRGVCSGRAGLVPRVVTPDQCYMYIALLPLCNDDIRSVTIGFWSPSPLPRTPGCVRTLHQRLIIKCEEHPPISRALNGALTSPLVCTSPRQHHARFVSPKGSRRYTTPFSSPRHR